MQQEIITEPKTKLRYIRTPQEILKIWEKARGIWKRKKLDPIKYLQKTRRGWERIL